ncbi:MAG: hypothetical protein PUE08_00060 [Eubacteriales bacterium]|nr:hypothetical protein [Eubacteriales bacterium]
MTIPLSKKLIISRSEDPGDTILLKNKLLIASLVILGVFSSVGLMLTVDDTPLLIRNLVLLIPIFSIAVVDSIIRKIPNSLLLVMIVTHAVYAVYVSIATKTSQVLIASLIGAFIGLLACTAPSLLRIPVGAGDIKYSGVIGLCLYLGGYLQAMVIMGLLALGAYIILKVTKKGGMKTLIPMGPFLSAGTVISMCFPLIDSLVSEVGVF